MRSIASLFDETDFRQYDEECNNMGNEEGEEAHKNVDVETRNINNEIVVIPNPNTGNFILSNLKVEEVANMILFDIQGRQLVENIGILSSEINISEQISSGLYMLSIKYKDGQFINKKVVITK